MNLDTIECWFQNCTIPVYSAKGKARTCTHMKRNSTCSLSKTTFRPLSYQVGEQPTVGSVDSLLYVGQ